MTSQFCLVPVLPLTPALAEQRFGIYATALAIRNYMVLSRARRIRSVIAHGGAVHGPG